MPETSLTAHGFSAHASGRRRALTGFVAAAALALAASPTLPAGAASPPVATSGGLTPEATTASGCPSPSTSDVRDSAGRVPRGPASSLTDPKKIRRLTAKAYEWGLPAEFVYRFLKYNNLVTAPVNKLGGGKAAAAWNNNATNAGDGSVLYLNAMLDLRRAGQHGSKHLVLTVPPSRHDYYVVNLLDSFVNTVGSIGTRTTPSNRPQTYLLVGPKSKYAHKRFVTIKGFRYRVMASDTNLNWMLIRIRADTLIGPSSKASASYVLENVVEKFALQSLAGFQRRHHRPKYFKPGYEPKPWQQRLAQQRWHNTPASAPDFFHQMGRSLRISPLPDKNTGLSGTSRKDLPSWVAPQPGMVRTYRVPSYGQEHTLARFAKLGLTEKGFRIPRNWGKRQLNALQDGYELGHQLITNASKSLGVSQATNYWAYANSGVGSYPNTRTGYETRAVIVLLGGSANLPKDAVYAQLNQYTDAAGNADKLDGNNTYTLTFLPPTPGAPVPVEGILPPMTNDGQGNPKGFWSIHVYQPDDCQAAAPFITQASVLNTAYSTANLAVTEVDPTTDKVTVTPSTWGPLIASSPVIFGPTAAQYGLEPDKVYYVRTSPSATKSGRKVVAYTFDLTTTWQQYYDKSETEPVPIQGDVSDGTPGAQVALANPGDPVDLTWGPVQPVSQLGSQQLTSGKLVRNPDQSVTIFIGPNPPSDPAFMPNWIPTPSTAYYEALYPQDGARMSTLIRPMIRMYYPAKGSNTKPSILPPPNHEYPATYVFPLLNLPN